MNFGMALLIAITWASVVN